MNHRLALARLVTWHLAPFVLLALGLTVALQSWWLPYFGAIRDEPDDRLVWVDPNGPAAQAGLHVGDVLFTVDGVPIDRSPLWSTKRAGESVVVRFRSVLSGSSAPPQVTRVILTAPPPRERALQLSLLLIAFSFWLIGTVVLFLQPRQPAARRLFLGCGLAATVIVAQPLVSVQVDWATRISGIAAAWVAAVLIDLHSLFPRRLDGRRSLVRGAYTVSGLLTGIYLLWDPEARTSSLWGLWISNLLLLYFLIAVGITVALLTQAYRRSSKATVQRRVRLVLAGTSLALAPPCLLLFAPLLLGLSPLVPDAVALLSLVVLPLAYAYGIYRYNLMGIDFLINRVVVYLTLGLLLLAVYFAVALVVLSVTGTAVLLAGALASLVAVAVVMPLRQQVDLAWERLFYPDVYGYRGAVDRVSRRLSEALNDNQLGDLLVRDLCDAMDLDGAALLLVREERLVLQASTGLLRALGRPGTDLLPASGALARSLIQAGAPVENETLSISEASTESLGDPLEALSVLSGQGLRRGLSTSFGIRSAESPIRLWVPLIWAGDLQGVLLLGAKRTDEFFNPRDRQLLRALAGQAALAVKNVRLVAELEAQNAEVTQDRQALQAAYRHLTRAREEERRHLATELHNDVIPTLALLSVGLGRCAGEVGGDARRELQALNDQVSEMVHLLRRICAGLRPPLLDRGLTPALRSHLRTFGDETGLEVELVCDEVDTLSEEVRISLFRVAQEALSNVRRHAQASTVYVHLTTTPDGLVLSVIDDGVGFEIETPAPAQGHHFGLRLMQEYVEALGGQLTIDTRPGGGTTITARVPHPSDRPAITNGRRQTMGARRTPAAARSSLPERRAS